MRRVFFCILFVFVLLASFCQAKFVSVSTTEGFIKELPNIKSDDVAGIPHYYPLYVLEKSKGWYRVRDWMRTEGWIPVSQVSDEQALMVRSLRANFRAGPAAKYKKIATLFRGYILKVEEKYGEWYKVKIVDPPEGTVGWIYRGLVWGY